MDVTTRSPRHFLWWRDQFVDGLGLFLLGRSWNPRLPLPPHLLLAWTTPISVSSGIQSKIHHFSKYGHGLIYITSITSCSISHSLCLVMSSEKRYIFFFCRLRKWAGPKLVKVAFTQLLGCVIMSPYLWDWSPWAWSLMRTFALTRSSNLIPTNQVARQGRRKISVLML